MATPSNIDKLYREYEDIIKLLDKHGDLSLRSTAQDNFRKTLLMAVASYFEYKIIKNLIDFFQKNTNENDACLEFLKNKAIYRQYHTFFKWDAKNANQFFGLFGQSFKEYMEIEIKKDENLNSSVKAFLELGNERNLLVHGNYITYPLEKTTDEIYILYQKATYFVDIFPKKLESFHQS